MFDAYFQNISSETKGILAFILGIILILGTLGKLGILQGILDSIMILMGVTLVIWGLNTSNGYSKIKNYLQPKE